MKKLIFGTMTLFILFALIIAGCNTPAGPGGPEGEGEEVIFNWGIPGTNSAPDNSPNYPGIMITLANCTDVKGILGDISLYGEVIIDASLYATKTNFDADPQVPIPQANGLGQFKILANSDWESELFLQKDNMNTNGETSAVVPDGSTGMPVNVLVQTHVDSGVGYIEIRKLTFKPRTGDVVLEEVFDNGSFLTASGNQLIFTGAQGTNHAAKYAFPDTWGTGEALNGKKITFTYTIPTHTCDPSGTLAEDANAIHQLHIQAAKNQGNEYFNGRNASPGQIYIDLKSLTGTFQVEANDLISASAIDTFSNNEGKGPFVLDAVRIVNDGTTYQTDIRCKSYTLVINSVTIAP